MSGIFVSYRRSDSQGEAGRLFDDLVKHFDEQTVFMDVSAIEAGRDFRKAIEEGVTKCGVLLVVMGPEWLNAKNEAGARRLDDPADFVRIETASALRRDIPVIPVLVRGALMPTTEQLPDDLKELAYRNCIELTHARWRSDIQLLLEALRRLGAASQSEGSAVFNPISNSALKPVTAAPRSSASHATTKSPKPQAEDSSTIDPAVIERVTRDLALYIGPIAGIVVKRAAATCSSMEDLYRTVAEEIDSRAEREKFLNQAAISPAAFSELTPSAIPTSSSVEDSPVAPRNEEPRRAVPSASGSQSPSRWKYSLIAIGGALILAIVVAAHFVRSRAANSPTTVQDKPQEPRSVAASPPAEIKTAPVEAKPSAAGTNPLAAPEIAAKSAEPKPKPPQVVHLSPEAAHGLLITEITPTYPPLARQAHIQGMVVIDADISRDGNVENLKATSGHPMLIPAAIDAVKQWKYKPYLLNGEPTRVNTQISVNFTLTGG